MKTSLTPWTTTSTKSIHKTPWIEVVEDTCQVGAQETQYTYTRRVDSGPVIVPVTADKKLWMVRQYRHPIKKIIWQFPAEGTMPGESWEQTAVRGLAEELQMTAQKLIDVGEFHPDPGGLDQAYHLFIAKGLSPLNSTEADREKFHTDEQHKEHEELEKRAFSLQEIDTLIESGEICDNWTLAGLYLFNRYLQN